MSKNRNIKKSEMSNTSYYPDGNDDNENQDQSMVDAPITSEDESEENGERG